MAFQGGFFRSIQEKGVVVHEVVHKLRIRKKGNKCDFLFKVDMLKAFDRVSWEFLFATLQAIGFHATWIQWIRSVVTTVRFNVLLNGAQTEWFNPTRGLRQGDPLSPYLFILVSNVLSFMIQNSVCLGTIKGIKLNRFCPVLHHILFADDTVLFGTATVSEARNIMLVLNRYCQSSGQAINAQKSSILFSANTSSSLKHQIASELGVSTLTSLGKLIRSSSRVGLH
ncbi:LINE-1 retrotransposable element ORF2 protein [Linum perenne]